MERALNNSAVERRVLWNQLPELVKDYCQSVPPRNPSLWPRALAEPPTDPLAPGWAEEAEHPSASG